MQGGHVEKARISQVQIFLVLGCSKGVCDVKVFCLLGEASRTVNFWSHSWLMHMTVFNHVYSAAVDVCGFVGRVDLYAFDF